MQIAGFKNSDPAEKGCPPFNPADLLKIYLYGYCNRIKSSRKLKEQYTRNIELIWLLNRIQPKYRIIACFRSNNTKAIKGIFRQFIVMIKRWDLISVDLLSVDGSKLRALNSKKNNYNQRKIVRHLKYIDEKAEEYLQEMEKNEQKGKANVTSK